MISAPRKAVVSMRAALARINRKLAHSGEVLKRSRSDRMRQEFGEFYIVRNNTITNWHIDPDKLARELGVLGEWEEISG